MRGAVLYGTKDVRFEERADPKIVEPTDVILKLSATMRLRVGSVALSRHRCAKGQTPMGTRILRDRRGCWQRGEVHSPRSVCGGVLLASDKHLRDLPRRISKRCTQFQYVGAGGAQAPFLRVPLADGTLSRRGINPLSATSRICLQHRTSSCTGWFGADAAAVAPGKTVAVIGDGAVGLCAVLAAKQMGAERIIAMSRPPGTTEARP